MDHPDYIRGARYSDLFAEPRPEGPSDCAYCPLCATIGAVRRTRPELVEHLAAAARELVLAAGLLLDDLGEALAPEQGGAAHDHSHHTHEPSNVTRIDPR